MRIPRLILLLLASLLAMGASAQSELPPTFQPAPRPLPSAVQFNAGLRLELLFSALTQGGSGLLRLSGADIASASYTFRGDRRPFFTRDGADWFALLLVDMNARPGIYTLGAQVERERETLSFTRDLRIDPAGYITQDLVLPPDRRHLADPRVETAEFERLAEITAGYTSEPLWDRTGFALPSDQALATPFGVYRTMNGGRETRHTGWDQNAPAGAPIRAVAAGVVAFAGPLEIRGNAVFIDHGLGIYSGYAHLSEIQVAVGQRVAGGQVIGSAGNTGRSSGAHLHWEIVGQGEWLDGLAFLDLWLPA